MSINPNDKDAFALIEELKKRIEALEKFKVEQEWLTNEIGNGQGKDRQTLAELQLYFDSKNRKRNDFDILAVQLLKKLLNRKKGMDYKDIMNTFDLTSANGAYKLMEKTALKFPADVKIHIIKNNKRRKRVIARVGGRLG